MSYSQLIQFKRLEERAFIFLNGRQMIFGFFGLFTGLSLAGRLDLQGWPVWLATGLAATGGVIAGARFRGLYGYQYLLLLIRSFIRLNKTVRPETLYDRPADEDFAYVLGAPDGGALVLREAPPPGAGRQTVSKEEGRPAVYRLRPVDLAQYPARSMRSLMNRWAGFWAGARPPLRLIVHSTPFHAGEVVEQVRRDSLMADREWRNRGLNAYSRFLETLVRESAMYQARHELIVWARSDTEAYATVSSLSGWLGVGAAPVELTPLLKGEYDINLDHLAPRDTRHPFIVLLVSHEFSGDWSWADPLVTLLRQPFPLSLALDIERNLASNEALKELVKYENVLLDILANTRTERNPKAEGALQDVQLAMAKANGGLSLHFSTVVVAVMGATLAEARRNVESVRAMTAARLALVVLWGGQDNLLSFFTETKRREIDLPEVSHNVMSDGMAVMSGPLGFRRRSETDGIFWGLGSSGGQDAYPLYWNGFGRDPDKPAAFHGLFLGKSGYGKTVSMNALLYREALRGTQVVLMEPQGHSRKLTDLVGADGASYNALSIRTMRLNPLDPISGDLNEQKSYVVSLVRLMLRQVDPLRHLTAQEAGLLDAALTGVYAGLETELLDIPLLHVPRLEQLCRELERLGADQLAGDLALNYVRGSLGAVYNRATNLDVGLAADVSGFDFRDIPQASRALIYTLVLGRIQRIVRSTGRIRRRIIAVDEFGWLAQEPMLATVIAMWIKTFRTFGCGVWMAEQDLVRLTGAGSEAGSDDLSGHSIIGNATFQLFFHHEAAAAEVVARTFPNVAPYREAIETFPRPQETGVAQAILRIPDGAYHTYMLLSDHEARGLLGS